MSIIVLYVYVYSIARADNYKLKYRKFTFPVLIIVGKLRSVTQWAAVNI